MIDVETNECLYNNGGCWQDKTANITACKVPIKIHWDYSCLIVCVPTHSCIYLHRILFVGECVNAPWLVV